MENVLIFLQLHLISKSTKFRKSFIQDPRPFFWEQEREYKLMHNLSLSLKYFWIFKITQIQNVFDETSHINNHQGKTIFLKPEIISLKVTSLSKM